MGQLQLGRRIRAYRKLKGLTQRMLACQANISLGVLGGIERGHTTTDQQMLGQIAIALGVTIKDLENNT